MKTAKGILWCPHCGQPHDLRDRLCNNTGKAIERRLHREGVPRHPLIGAVIDSRYRIEGFLGAGGNGIVFEGTNLALGREVAIKIVRSDTDDVAIERLRREATILSSLRHANVCDIYDFGIVRNVGPYVVTERLRGETIAERLKWQRCFKTVEGVELLVQILSALHAAHALQIVHRDVKPQNVFVIERLGCGPLVKLLDFGLAKNLSLSLSRQLTRPGKMVGTPHYMSPEQLMGLPVGPTSDLFSVGALAYEMLTGRHPFASTTIADMQAKILRENPRPMSYGSRRVAPAVEAVIMRALAKRPEDRPRDAHSMQQLLQAALDYYDQEEADPPSSTGF